MNKKENKVGVEIYQSIPLAFEVNNEYAFEGELNNDDLNIFMESEFGLNMKDSKVGVRIKVVVSTKENVQELFEISTFFEFGIFDLKDVVLHKDGKDRLTPEIARKLMNISIGGTRGMLAIYLTSTQYKGFTLPIANLPEKLFI